MKVLFVHREPSLASARVRVLNLAPHLRELGVACETARFPRNPFALRSLLAGSDADVVVIQKKAPTAIESWAWGGSRVPIVFDFDDAIFSRQTARGGSFESPTRQRRFARALRRADAFACGNAHLASFCGKRAKPVLIAPSAVPLDVPQAVIGEASGPARIGWIGAPHNLDELRTLAPALRRLARRLDFVLAVIGESSVTLDGIRVEHVPWTLATQEAEIARLDVGLMPLVDTPWTRGKCAYKLLQYMAAGVPAVASPVGMNREVISHASNGLLADAESDWLEALDELLRDPALARRLARAGRETVVERFGYPRVAGLFREFLETLSTR